jgi:phage-related protein
MRPIEVVVPVMLDGREIARSTARVAADQLARR